MEFNNLFKIPKCSPSLLNQMEKEIFFNSPLPNIVNNPHYWLENEADFDREKLIVRHIPLWLMKHNEWTKTHSGPVPISFIDFNENRDLSPVKIYKELLNWGIKFYFDSEAKNEINLFNLDVLFKFILENRFHLEMRNDKFILPKKIKVYKLDPEVSKLVLNE